MGYCKQLKLLLWKNFIIKKRKPLILALELIIPLGFFLVAAVIRQFEQPLPIHPERFRAYPLPSAGLIPMLQEMCNIQNNETDEDGFYTKNNERLKQLFQNLDDFEKQHANLFRLKVSPEELERIPNTYMTLGATANSFNRFFKKLPNSTLSKMFHDPEAVIKHLYTEFDFPLSSLQKLFNYPLRSSKMSPYLMRKLGDMFIKGQVALEKLKNVGKIRKLITTFPTAVSRNVVDQIKATALQYVDFRHLICPENSNSNDQNHYNKSDWVNNNQVFSSFCELNNTRVTKLIFYLIENLDYQYIKSLNFLTKMNPKTIKHDFEQTLRNVRVLFSAETYLREMSSVLNDELHNTILGENMANKTFFSKVISNLIQKYICGNNGTLISESPFHSLLTKSSNILYSPTNSDADIIIKKINQTLGFPMIDVINQYAISFNKMVVKMEQYLDDGQPDQIKRTKLMKLTLAEEEDENNVNENISISDFFDKQQLLHGLRKLSSMASAWLQYSSRLKLDKFKGFQDENSLLNYLLTEANTQNNSSTFAAVNFIMNGDGSLPQHVTYSIRQPAILFPETNKIKYRHWYNTHITKGSGYYYGGFVQLQDLIDRAIISMHSEHDVVEPGNYIQEIPRSCYLQNKLIEFLEHFLPLNAVICWVYVVAILVQYIVREKEYRLKEVMKSMGMSEMTYFLSWFLLSLFFCTVMCVLLTAIVMFSGVFIYSDVTFVFVTFELYGISVIAISFLFSSFFSNAKVASACAGIGYFLLFVPSIYIGIQEEFNYSTLTAWQRLIFLISPTVFSRIASFFAYYEQMNSGAKWSNWDKSPITNDTFGMKSMVLMLALDSVLYLLLSWYINNVFPGDYGLPRRWNFLFTKSYWSEVLSSNSNSSESGVLDQPPEERRTQSFVTNESTPYFESDPTNMICGVCIDRLVKMYGRDKKVAVKDLSLNFYEGQITAFLGHNGAGKTTTLSILTGIFPPTSGTATIYGLDIRNDMTRIRRLMGMCPQHNVLFNELTVEEHLWFYANLKGIPRKDIAEEMERIIDDIGLKKKHDKSISSLTGGMKRKLSVAIAFVGGSRAVILDEPTSGIDPCSRRDIWDLILKYKKGRTIILSTHHMDEAETLADRIAIISNGRLQCYGSPVHLINNLGTGYHLYLAKDVIRNPDFPLSKAHDFQSSPERQWIVAVSAFIREYVPTAKLLSESSYELHYMLPLTELKNGNYEKLFAALDSHLSSLRVGSYGVKSTTLEEVFLHVTAQNASHSLSNKNKKVVGLAIQKDIEQDAEKPNIGKDRMPANFRRSDWNETKNRVTLQSLPGRLRKRKVQYQRIPLEDSVEIITPEITTDGDFGASPMYRDGTRCIMFLQLCAILRKRYCCTKRNWTALFTQILLPAIFVSIAMSVALMVPSFDEPHPLLLSTKQFHNFTISRGQFVTFSNVHADEKKARLTKDASSSRLESTLLLPSGLGPDCILTSKNNLVNSRLYPEMFESKCRVSMTGNESLLLDGRYKYDENRLSISPLDRRYYPVCQCSPKMSTLVCYGDYNEPSAIRLITGEIIVNISGYKETDYLINTYDTYREHRYGGLSFGFFHDFLPQNTASDIPEFVNNLYVQHAAKAWFESSGFHTRPVFVNALNNAILRANIPPHKGNPAAYGITVLNHPLPNTTSLMQFEYFLFGTDLVIASFVITAMAFVPASFVLNLVHERQIKAKQLHMISGLKPVIYWAGNYMWDVINYQIPSAVCLTIFLLFGVPAYTQGANYLALTLLFLFYGWAMTPAMYPSSFFFREPSVAYIILVIANLFLGFTCITIVFLMSYDNENKILVYVSDILDNLFLILPNYCLGKGLMDLAINDYKNQYYTRTGQLEQIKDSFSWNYIPKKVIAMTATGLICFCITLFFERHSSRKDKKSLLVSKAQLEPLDEDVAAENRRVRQGGAVSDVLHLNNLTKVFYDKKFGKLLAVDNICIGIPQGECFGFIGNNGAGKSVVYHMLTGEISISSGDAIVNGYSIRHNFQKAKRFLGYCPQFDALHDDLTAREHLQIYSCFRGISKTQQKKVVDWSLVKLDLVAYADQLVKTYSGGTKRKLSTALALLGNPPVILLDEPTTGMDPRSKRFLWDTIRGLLYNGQTVILTTHSMEECEALCNRLAIMVKGRFCCLGSAQYLKSTFGRGYSITIRLKDAEQDISIIEYIATIFPKAILKEKRHNLLHYEMQKPDVSLAYIFSTLEHAIDQYPIEDYSVSQNTLDNVFTNFIKEQQQQTENSDVEIYTKVKSDETYSNVKSAFFPNSSSLHVV